ncbi:hypothetical protein [Leclercia sp.]|uniref:hypothetical protein n=1 Tax=Leclercia sp. TaxID=1898428 RepID=UPI0028BDC3D4|nr:hypothetical protein [Leclercia sp.]
MTPEQQDQLVDMLAVTGEVMGNELKPGVIMVMVQDLAGFEFAAVANALVRCRRELTGKLTLKAIIEFAAPAAGWLSANEAWSLALPAADERNTVVWTREAREAFNIARPLLEDGDKIGARMAFIGAYERNVAMAKAAGAVPGSEVSEGWDKTLRAVAVEQAVSRGLLPAPRQEAVLALPNLSPEQVQANRSRIAELMRTWRESMRQAEADAVAEQARQRQEAREEFERERDEVVAQALAMDEERKRKDTP